MSRKAIVILSGGQDSTVCAAMAKRDYEEVHAVTFDYGQRHKIELDSAVKVAELLKLDSHEIVDVAGTLEGSSPLLDPSAEVGHYADPSQMPGGIEPTFVPMRNLLFLTIAANRAAIVGAKALVTGVCEADYGGYPDCRQSFIDAAAEAIGSALTGDPWSIQIVTPLMRLTKADTVLLAKTLPNCWEALAYTHTCYNGCYPPNPFNHASMIRARGFHDAKLPDPLIERAIAEDFLPTDYPPDGFVPDTKYAMGVLHVNAEGKTTADYQLAGSTLAPTPVDPAPVVEDKPKKRKVKPVEEAGSPVNDAT